MRQFSTRQVLSRKPDTVQEPEFEDDLEDKGHGDGRRTSRPPTQTAEGPKPDDGSRTTLRIESGGSRGLFAQANELNSKKTSFNTDTYPADRRERDAAIQRDISEAEDRVARERLARETREARRRRWAWFMSLWSLDWLFGLFRTPPPPVEEEEEDEHDDVTDGPTEWWRLLHPRTYGQTMLWLIDTIMDQVVDVMDRVSNANLRDYIPRPGKNFGMAAAGIFGLIVMALIGPVIIGMLRTFSLPDAGSLPSTGGIHLPSIGGIAGKIGGFIPSLAWPLRRSRGDLDDLFASLGPEDNAQELVNKVWEHYEKSIGAMKKDSRLHQASLQKLETVVPKIVRMELKNGKPIVTQEFWHALRDLIHGDGSFVTLEKNSGAYEFTSDEQWKAIRARLIKDPTYTSKLNATAAGIEDRLEAKMPRAWDAWVKNNEDKIAELIGPALDKIQSAGSGREFDERLKKIVKDQVQGGDLEDVIVTRAEFLHHLQNEFALHRAEIRAEIKALQPQLEELREEMQAATRNQPQGVSKGEIAALVKSLVLKAVGDMNLEGMAKGKIHYHWAAELKNQVNYFAIGAGATIDGKRTSTTYDPLDQGTVAPDAFIRGIRSVAPLPPIAALSPWEDEGDCWCAARSVNHRGNPHGATLSVQLGRRVVPQHVVVEHLLPGATSDPAARPRHIEVYAHFEDHVVRERVRDFAATHLPDATNDRDFQAPGYGPAFVKIAQFVYEGAELHDGVHVHRLHSDLAALGAATDQVIVRAVSNYGADTHTCFYRVRLFGKPLAIDEL
ncbi:hypothetical protein QQX98_003652 [Neonectria punicea]|uniref:SUN domain-containing protein n=1 Tax=Neonectria punicea TaxID=979145 RepID=A0ABR1HD11_9HYPO